MKYVITSSKKVCGRLNGEELTESDILSAGGSVEHLLAAGHIAAANAEKVIPAVKEVPAVQQEEEFPVFNSVNNEQGEKQPWQD